jgi:hypothetical protein
MIAAIELDRLLTGVDFHPVDLALALVSTLHGLIDHAPHHRRHIDTDAVAFDERNDGLIWHIQAVIVIDRDAGAVLRDDDLVVDAISHVITSVHND